MPRKEMTFKERYNRIRQLVDDRDYWIGKYSRDLIQYKPLYRFKLTASQRRVIASLKINRELASLDNDRNRQQEPPPVMGYDENDRVVVQRYEKGYPDNIHCWALGREGQPMDIKGCVRSLKDGRITLPATKEW